MRQTPAQRSYMAKLAAQQQARDDAANAHGETVGDAYELQMAQLFQHKRDIREIKSIEMKKDAKRAILPAYDAYLDGVLQARPGTKDEVIATVLVWHIDAGNYERALQIGEYMIEANMAPPDGYQRNLATVLQEDFADAIISGKSTGKTAVDLAVKVMELTSTADTPDQVKAKLAKAAGWAILGKTKISDVDIAKLPEMTCAAALPYLQYAMQMDQQAGVKKDIERLERRVSKSS